MDTLDNQNRLHIPCNLFNNSNISQSNNPFKLALNADKGNYSLSIHANDEQVSYCIGFITIDNKKRFSVPKQVRKTLKEVSLESFLIYLNENNVITFGKPEGI